MVLRGLGKLYDDQSEAATMPSTHTYTTACTHKVALLNVASSATGRDGQTREIHYMEGRMASHHELAPQPMTL